MEKTFELVKNTFKCVWTNIFPNTLKRKRPESNKNTISATKTRNYLLNDPILDWLNLYGEKNGFIKDNSSNSYSNFLLSRGQQFEKYIMDYLKPSINSLTFIDIDSKYKYFNEQGVEETLEHMRRGTHVIYQGYLMNKDLGIHGIPDLLIRGDIIRNIFGIYPVSEMEGVTGNREYRYVYYVVDIKFSSIHYGKRGNVLNRGSAKAYKAQLFLYNKILENLFFGRSELETPFQQPYCFLLGRRIVTSENEIYDGKKVLALLDMNKDNIAGDVRKSLNWLLELRSDGEDWDIINPEREEMMPNLKNDNDYPWHNAKFILGRIQNDPTHYVGVNKKMRMDMQQSGQNLGQYLENIPENKRDIVRNMLNTSEDFVCYIREENIGKVRELFDEKINFYVDFEFISGSDLTFDYMTRNHLYMIGMGWEEEGKFNYECFIPRRLTNQEEKLNISRWLTRMRSISNGMDRKYRVIHWTKAETRMFDNLKELFCFRGEVEWYDLHPVFRDNQIVCKGMNNFSLKTVAKSFKKLGYIETVWEDNICDGLGANMVIIGGKEGGNEYLETYVGMDEVRRYNLVDCKTMWELVKFLRCQIN